MVVASICKDKDVKKWIYIPEVGKKMTWEGMGKVKKEHRGDGEVQKNCP